MIGSRSNTEEPAVRSERYRAELREFFAASGVRFGCAEDLPLMTERLREDNVFRDEMGSMTRSIMFREGGSLPPSELLSLLATAVGGADVNDRAQQFHTEMRDLLRFTASVVRTPRNQPRSESTPSGAGSDGPVPAFSGQAVVSPTAGLPEDLPDSATDGGRFTPLSADIKRFASRRKKWWWIPAGGVGFAAVLLILLPSHPGVRPQAGAPHISPTAETRAPEATAEPTALEQVETSPSAAPADRNSASGLSTRKISAGKDPGSEPSSDSRGLAAGAETSAAMPRPVNSAPAPQSLVPGRPASAAGGALDEVRPQPERMSHLAPSSTRNVPGVHAAERSPAHKIVSNPSHRGVLDVSSGVMGANLVWAPTPEYPRLASVMHVQGAVILQAVIGKNGLVLATHVLRGHYLLRGAAEQTVRKWRYRPFVSDGHPVDLATVVTVDFHRNH